MYRYLKNIGYLSMICYDMTGRNVYFFDNRNMSFVNRFENELVVMQTFTKKPVITYVHIKWLTTTVIFEYFYVVFEDYTPVICKNLQFLRRRNLPSFFVT